MRRECHGHSERTAAAPGLLQIGEQRVHHLHDGPGRRAERDEAPGSAVQDVGGDGGDRGGGAADRLHHGALSLPEHVHIAGKRRSSVTFRAVLLLLCATCGSFARKRRFWRTELGRDDSRWRSQLHFYYTFVVFCAQFLQVREKH